MVRLLYTSVRPQNMLKNTFASVSVMSHDFKADYKCFDVENEFVVGYGVDYAEHYRTLPYIGVLKS